MIEPATSLHGCVRIECFTDFALVVTILAEGFGTIVGAILGYYGGKVDILGVRFIEIWSRFRFCTPSSS
jgi:ABC-type microcin C transport system permease subunit YejE